MGYAIAEELASNGAKVKLISGPVNCQTQNNNIEVISIESAHEMYEQSIKHFKKADGAVMAAAVADYTIEKTSDKKIKRIGDSLTLELKPTKDIAAQLGKIKKKEQLLVGFALETNDEYTNAQKKLKNKNLDFIVLNSLQDKGAGFGTDTNKITIITNSGKSIDYTLKDKKEVAKDIVEQIIEQL
eukprot:Anaeramoba_ignava/c19967_g2_i2.p4 GENE.c19967_g2_i2~~c19967_g2_i2.p4  ORF type:complete len:185 (+),score=44.77 c19967_g2_i2:1913-2467(+)